MGYNIYKQLPKFREYLKNKGHVKDIPLEVFGRNLMLFFGMKKTSSVSWIKDFSEVGLIKVEDGKVNFT